MEMSTPTPVYQKGVGWKLCCDGTGFTGEPGIICPDHYESPGQGWFDYAQREADRFDDYGPSDF